MDTARTATEQTSVVWHEGWISLADARAIVILPKKLRRICPHSFRRIVVRQRGGWNHICLRCGARKRFRREKNPPVQSLTLEESR